MRLRLLMGLAALLLAAHGARASDPTGIYALVDKVEIEPSEGQPERARVWGVFAVSVGDRGDEYTTPARGYIYFTLPAGKEEVARKEWNDLKKVAGTRTCVAFSSRYKMENVKVRTDKDVTKGAVAYPTGFGITKLPPNQYMAKRLLDVKPKP